ncbi:MAG: 2OG-Fe(II) oxygenase family protein [Nostoc sp.]|uniref:2OG-Fe(II) oxygenase family protein n=1 Tax=Nostoc sp. TaxID=1180 RepID=UPI002FF6737A
MLNLNAIRSATMQSIPYQYALLENLLLKEVSGELSQSYPQHDFRELRGDDFCYLWRRLIANDNDITTKLGLDNFWQRRIELGDVTSDIHNLSSVWQRLIQEIWQPEYTMAMEELSGLELSSCVKVMALRRYRPGDYVLPHTDQPSKILTHLLFLNEQWSSSWGGCLQILKNEQPESVHQNILPLSGYSVVFVRSENSWHMVNLVTSEAVECRLAAQVAFFRI